MTQQNDNTSLQSRQTPLLEGMLHELKTNVHFSGKSLHHNDHLTDCSSQLISELTQSLHLNSVPALSSKQFKPLLKLWHHLLKEHLQHGFSTKDTAFMIYALRNSVLTQIKKIKVLFGKNYSTRQIYCLYIQIYYLNSW